ncbi:MAG: dipeptide ABC transporter ATP-binding protein [Alphaproteobacteria bacterium]
MSDLLQVKNLRVQFKVAEGLIKAVDGISFRIPANKTVALVGESGSGKSVVSQSIMRILPKVAEIASGEILFFDPAKPGAPPTDIAKLDADGKAARSIRGGRISIIFQEPMTSLSPLHTIGDQVGEAFALHNDAPKAEVLRVTEEMLRLVGFPDPAKALRTYPFELSGGLRQRAMIAMALVCRPALLIADEPTTALDVTIQAQIIKLMKDLQAELGMAILIITHDLGVVANMADEVVVMYHGKVTEAGDVKDIFNDPQHPYLKALLRAVPRFDMEPGERLVPIREIKAETGKFIGTRETWPAGAEAGTPLLSVRDLTKSFTIRKSGLLGTKAGATVKAVDRVSFDVMRGECLGLVGESGCGKTTLSKLVLRAISADDGTISFNDRGKLVDVRALKENQLIRFRKRIQFIFQDPYSSLNPRMTVFDIIAEPLIIHGIAPPAERREIVQELMRLVGLDPRYLRRYPHSFSGGQRQRIGIARALALKPDLLICDEPVSALDVSIQAQVLNLLRDLQDQLGLTYLFISHNLAVVDYIADRIAVMCAGRVVEIAPRERMFTNPQHPYTKALVAAVPEPNLETKLDLTALMAGKASIPAEWPEPFTIDEANAPELIEIEPGHFVRAGPALVASAA